MKTKSNKFYLGQVHKVTSVLDFQIRFAFDFNPIILTYILSKNSLELNQIKKHTKTIDTYKTHAEMACYAMFEFLAVFNFGSGTKYKIR